MRHLFLLLALAGAAVLATTAPAAVGNPQKKHTPAGMAVARSVLLKRTDLGAGWTAKPSSSSGSDNLSCKGFRPDESDLVEIGSADSPDFSHGEGIQLSQTAGVFRTAAMADASWSRVVRPGMLTCLASLLQQQSTKDVTFAVVRSGPLAFPKLAPKSAAYRLVANVTAKTTTLRVYLDLVLLGRGQLLTAVFGMSFGQPLPASFEQSLGRVVAARLAAAQR